MERIFTKEQRTKRNAEIMNQLNRLVSMKIDALNDGSMETPRLAYELTELFLTRNGSATKRTCASGLVDSKTVVTIWYKTSNKSFSSLIKKFRGLDPKDIKSLCDRLTPKRK